MSEKSAEERTEILKKAINDVMNIVVEDGGGILRYVSFHHSRSCLVDIRNTLDSAMRNI